MGKVKEVMKDTGKVKKGMEGSLKVKEEMADRGKKVETKGKERAWGRSEGGWILGRDDKWRADPNWVSENPDAQPSLEKGPKSEKGTKEFISKEDRLPLTSTVKKRCVRYLGKCSKIFIVQVL